VQFDNDISYLCIFSRKLAYIPSIDLETVISQRVFQKKHLLKFELKNEGFDVLLKVL